MSTHYFGHSQFLSPSHFKGAHSPQQLSQFPQLPQSPHSGMLHSGILHSGILQSLQHSDLQHSGMLHSGILQSPHSGILQHSLQAAQLKPAQQAVKKKLSKNLVKNS